jgi:hypothetical protein
MDQVIESLGELGFVVGALAIALLVLPFFAILASIYLWRLWIGDIRRPRSWLLRDLAISATVATTAAFGLGWLALRRLLGQPSLGEEGLVILAFGVVVLEILPIGVALSAYVRESRR